MKSKLNLRKKMSMNKEQKVSQREIIKKPIYCNLIEFYVLLFTVLYGKKNILHMYTLCYFFKNKYESLALDSFSQKNIMSKFIYHLLLNKKKLCITYSN